MGKTSFGSAFDRSLPRYALLFFAGLLAFYAAWVLFWLYNPGFYAEALGRLDIAPVFVHGQATPRPFFDIEGVLSWSECARRGFDVVVYNPCDPIGRPLNYSPLLAIPVLGVTGTAWTIPFGFAIGLSFLAVLPFVMRPRTSGEVVICWLAAMSPAVLYGVERANIDVMLFTVIALAIFGAPRAIRLRMVYGTGFVLGLAKFFPFSLLVLVARERLRLFAVLTVAAVAVMALFGFVYRLDLARMVFPGVDWSDLTFSARNIGNGMSWVLGVRARYVMPFLIVPLALGGVYAWRLSRRLDPLLPSSTWNDTQFALLLSAAVIMVACFLCQANNIYRAVFLLAALPGLLRLREAAGGRIRTTLTWASAVLVACLWADAVRRALDRVAYHVPGVSPPTALAVERGAAMILHEALWWFEISVLAAIVLSFVRRSRAMRQFAALLRGRRQAA